jgi:hypothetical protein
MPRVKAQTCEPKLQHPATLPAPRQLARFTAVSLAYPLHYA